CIDRGALGTTRLGKGSKIDNLVQVGHNVEIGERVVIAAQTGISGSTVIESDAVIGGQVGFGDHARVLSGPISGPPAGVVPGHAARLRPRGARLRPRRAAPSPRAGARAPLCFVRGRAARAVRARAWRP